MLQPSLPPIGYTSTLPASTMCTRNIIPGGKTTHTPCAYASETARFCEHPQTIVSSPPQGHLSPSLGRHDQFPPTPPRSTHSNDSERSSKRRSGSAIYISGSGSKTSEVGSSRHSPSPSRSYLESPPLSRSPGRSSLDEPIIERRPRTRRDTDASERSRPASTHRRPEVRVEVVNHSPPPSPRANTRATRRPSHSRHSSQESIDREELSRQRVDELYLRNEEDRRQETLRREIERQNEDIKNRPAPPEEVVHTQRPSKPSPYRRPSVAYNGHADVTSKFEALRLQEQREQREVERRERREAERQERREAERQERRQARKEKQASEAQADRLRERMNRDREQRPRPQRRESVAPSRRPTVTFDDPYRPSY